MKTLLTVAMIAGLSLSMVGCAGGYHAGDTIVKEYDTPFAKATESVMFDNRQYVWDDVTMTLKKELNMSEDEFCAMNEALTTKDLKESFSRKIVAKRWSMNFEVVKVDGTIFNCHSFTVYTD